MAFELEIHTLLYSKVSKEQKNNKYDEQFIEVNRMPFIIIKNNVKSTIFCLVHSQFFFLDEFKWFKKWLKYDNRTVVAILQVNP